MRMLIVAAGSCGDLYLIIAIGRALRKRGRDIVFFSSGYFLHPAASGREIAAALDQLVDCNF